MIWFFLAGMVAGAVGWNMLLLFWYKTRTKPRKMAKETPDDVMAEFLAGMKVKKFRSEDEAIEYVDEMQQRMTEAIERERKRV